MAQKIFECEVTDEEEVVLRLHVPAFRRFLPETRGHLLSARKEVLLAFRSLIDTALEKVGEEPESTRRTIKVE